MNLYVFFSACMAATAGLLFGFDTGNIAGALVYIKQAWSTTTFANELIVSVTVLGAFMSALWSTRWADRFGRRKMLLFAAIFFIVGALWGAYSPNVTDLVCARFLLGVAIGISSYTAPLYISEIAPAHFRGRLVLLNGIAITAGEALAYIVDYYFAASSNWHLMILMGIIPGFILLIGMFFLPDSPRWLVLKEKSQEAYAVLKKIRKTNFNKEFEHIQQSATQFVPSIRLLFSKSLRRILIIGVGLGIFQQFFGINTLMYYGPFIFAKAGYQSGTGAILATFGLGVVNVVMTIFTGIAVDQTGRRRLLLIGSSLAGFSLLLVSFLFHGHLRFAWQTNLLLISMMTFIIGYCISVGSLFWLIIAEIFPLFIRSTAMGFATAVQWSANFVVSITFLTLLNQFGPSGTFSFYALMCFLALAFIYLLVPETKGLSLEKIEQQVIKENPEIKNLIQEASYLENS